MKEATTEAAITGVEPALVHAPWSLGQVLSLAAYQHAGMFHGYTAPRDPGEGATLLIPTPEGWRKTAAGPVVQTWARRTNADWTWTAGCGLAQKLESTTEVEHRYLARFQEIPPGNIRSSYPITQGYLGHAPTTRVRVQGAQAFLTVKAMWDREWEWGIHPYDACSLLELIPRANLVRKTRHVVLHERRVWEVDVFEEQLAGLVIAEIELESEAEEYARPPWLGRGITRDDALSNAALARYGLPHWFRTEAQ